MSKRVLIAIVVLGVSTLSLAQGASFSVGPATLSQASLIDCGAGSRTSALGRIRAEDGTQWTVPAPVNFDSARKAADLFNQCGAVRSSGTKALDLETVPLIDAGGDEEFVAYVFADNYFEFYVNGKLLAVDAVPFTPFNSSVIRFKARRPVTLAFMAVDWEENLGLGSERNRGQSHFPGDAGIVAVVQDAAGKTVSLTDASWRAQTFYVAPLADRACLVENGALRDSSACSTRGSNDGSGDAAAHWPLPANWMQPGFDDRAWPQAVEFSNDVVGVDGKPAYTNFTDIFDREGADAQFIWSSNLVLDNLVLLRGGFR